MSDNSSDYKLSRADVHNLLPAVNQNPLVKALSETTFNRFYTKPELQRVIGTIGHEKHKRSKDQITEADVYDQAFQLQVAIKNAASTETQITTYKDIKRICTQIGIDIDRVTEWQNAEQFNYALPINLDKIINFNEYYWIGGGTPQYVTIQSHYIKIQTQLSQLVKNLVATNDSTIESKIATLVEEIRTTVPQKYRIGINDLPTQYNVPSLDGLTAQGSDWSKQNHWVHRLDVTDLSIAQQAKLPIIEYNDTVQLTEWTYTHIVWKYRKSAAYPFEVVDQGPINDELFTSYPIVACDSENESFTISGFYPDTFEAGSKFTIDGSTIFDKVWTVLANEYDVDSNQTTIFVTENVISDDASGNILPFITTSRGDGWKGFFQHWMVADIESAVPSTPPESLSTDNNVLRFTATANQKVFPITHNVGADTTRVYLNGRRQYGTYSESSDSVTFYKALSAGDTVEVFPNVLALADMGRERVMVRVSEIDSDPHRSLCLVQYRKQEQLKTFSNQYPLFDMVDMNGNSTHESNSIFTYAEDGAYNVEPFIGKRIVRDLKTKDFTYDVGIVNADGTLKYYVDAEQGVSSVWCKNLVNPQYVPIKVDANREPSTASDAVYEIPKQLLNNTHHEVRNRLQYSELFLHFKSIVDAQVAPTMYSSSIGISNVYRLQDTINYGAGGTIKEYNYSFDMFVSSLISSDYTLPAVLNFAENQYAELLVKVREYIEQSATGLATSSDSAALKNFQQYVVTKTFNHLHNDTTLERMYGDSSVTMGSAVPNWVATLPYLRLSKAVRPELLQDAKLGINKLIHHDGHSVLAELNTATSKVAKDSLVSNLGLYVNGVQQPCPVKPKIGQLWYDASSDTLYRLDVTSFSASYPLGSFEPQSYWYNPTDHVVSVFQNGVWVATSQAISDRFVVLDLDEIITQVIFMIEEKLYEGVKDQSLWIDIDQVRVDHSARFDRLMQLEFENYCKATGIDNPYTGDFDQTKAFTWDYSVYQLSAARWYDINQLEYNTPYPHLQPWAIQGYDFKPTWWDAEYKGMGRRWSTEMWYNIQHGIVPAGVMLPYGGHSTGSMHETNSVYKTSVNTTDHTTIDGYGPDDLLPPYWIPSRPADNLPGIADQVFVNDNAIVIASVANNIYPFGTNGPIENEWKQSIGYNYARLKTAFRLDPVRFTHYTFGDEFTVVNGLEVNARTNKISSHKDVIFHGDADQSGKIRYFEGMNQLYVLFFRYNALDLNGSEFKRAWTTWTTQMCYNLGGFVVDKTLSVDSTRFEITPNDYNVEVKTARQVRDIWIDALYVTITQGGSYRELPMGAGRDWKFSVGTHCPVSRPISYFGVKKYRVIPSVTNNTFDIVDGTLSLAGWNKGDSIVFATGTNGNLPNAIDDVSYYFIIPISDTRFMIADSRADAILGKNIPLLTAGSGVLYVAELNSTFFSFEGKNTPVLWKHFALNMNDVRTFNSGVIITGVQNVVDIVDGYSAYLSNQGVIFNDSDVQEYDESNNRILNWQYEVEFMINTLYVHVTDPAQASRNSKAYQIGEIELNPFRNNLWVQNATGVVSEFNAVNVKDAGSQAVIYDNKGKRIGNRHIMVMRQDRITHLASTNQSFDTTQSTDFSPINTTANSMGGVHVFFDEYEHVLMFNNYTIANGLMYDGFLGIMIPRVHTYFEKQIENTKRPNVGGFVINNGKMKQNYEYTVSNMLKYYDTFTVNENADFINNARALLGYSPNAKYLTDTNVTPKSQFLFYKGMIKAKGTIGSIKAFTSSRHFEASTIDEFWAYRAYDFGDNRLNVSYNINLTPEDTVRSHLKFEFVTDPSVNVDRYFTKIARNDATRWDPYPSQADVLGTDYGLFKLKPSTIGAAYVHNITTPSVNGSVNRKVIFHQSCLAVSIYQLVTEARQKFTKVVGTSSIITDPVLNLLVGADSINVYVNGQLLNIGTDYVELAANAIKLLVKTNSTDVVVIIPKTATLRQGQHYVRLNSRTVQLLIDGVFNLQLVTQVANYATFSPVKIYDVKSGAVVADVPAWDPASNVHHSDIVKSVDITEFDDIAIYNNSPDVQPNSTTKFWDQTEVGKVWLDTSSFAYIPYADFNVDPNDALVQWGKLSEGSDPVVRQWVESKIKPRAWVEQNGADGYTGIPHSEVYSRSRTLYEAHLAGRNWYFTTTHPFVVGDEIAINCIPVDDNQFGEDVVSPYPAPMRAGAIYTVATVTDSVITIADRAGEPIVFTEPGTGSFTISSAYYEKNWTRVRPKCFRTEALRINFINNDLVTTLTPYSEYTMYLNGVYVQDGAIQPNGIVVLEDTTLELIGNQPERFEVTVLTKATPDANSPETRPADLDLSNSSTQAYIEYPYTRVDAVAHDGLTIEPLFYFWVRGKADPIQNTKLLTTNRLEFLVSNHDSVYMLAMKPTIADKSRRLRQLAVSGVTGVVSEPDRYVLRMINDLTLRDDLIDAYGSMVKPVYAEWIMFREGQTDRINRNLWDRITESIIGYKLNNVNIAVPSLDRVVYDTVNQTSIRYGMEPGQAFVSGQLAMETILAVLNNPDVVYEPVDVDYFLATHDTSTSAGIVKFMDHLYRAFPSEHVNRIFFAVMQDALANIAVDYSASLMKTSAISVNGVSPLNVNGALDD